MTPAPAIAAEVAVDVASHEPASAPCLGDLSHSALATPAPVASAGVDFAVADVGAAAQVHAGGPCSNDDPDPRRPAPSTDAAAGVAPIKEDEVSLALARMLLVAGDAPPVPTTNVDGNPLTPTTSLAASPPAEATTTEVPPRAATTTTTTLASVPVAPPSLEPRFGQVYSRRQRQSQIAEEASMPVDATPPARPNTPNSGQRKQFLAKITKKTVKILPTPSTSRPHSRISTPCAPPRHSRRIAGMEPATPGGGGATSRTKKKVMRALDIIGEMAGIDQQSLEEYSRLFSGSARLPDSQALALSALFGWAAPDEEELARVTGC